MCAEVGVQKVKRCHVHSNVSEEKWTRLSSQLALVVGHTMAVPAVCISI